MENFLSNLLGSFGIFPSKEKLEKREAYQNEMFPFGDEEKRLVTQHLQRVNRMYPVNKTLFLFLIILAGYVGVVIVYCGIASHIYNEKHKKARKRVKKYNHNLIQLLKMYEKEKR